MQRFRSVHTLFADQFKTRLFEGTNRGHVFGLDPRVRSLAGKQGGYSAKTLPDQFSPIPPTAKFRCNGDSDVKSSVTAAVEPNESDRTVLSVETNPTRRIRIPQLARVPLLMNFPRYGIG